MKYKVGDKVRVISNLSGHGLKIGSVTKIEYIDEDCLGVGMCYNNGEWWLCEMDLDGVTEYSATYINRRIKKLRDE